MKSFLSQLIRVFMAFSIFIGSATSYGSERSVKASGSEYSQINIGTDSKSADASIKVNIETMTFDSADSAEHKVSEVVATQSRNQKTTVVLSTSSEEVIRETLENPKLDSNNLNIAPLESLERTVEELRFTPTYSDIQTPTAFQKLLRGYSDSAKNSIKNDKIGLMVLTYTTAAETLVWVHNTHLTELERTGSIVYTVALALAFGINKDNWSKATRPFQAFFRKIIKPDTNNSKDLKEMGTRFLGNLSLAMIISSGRVPFMTMNDIIDTGLKLHYFTMPLLLSVVSTAAIFTWSEHIASINEKTHPIAKFVFRRISETRSIFLATFAATAALINPAQHGIGPWLTVAGVGVLGATIYLKGQEITNWVENIRAFQLIKKKMESFKGSSRISEGSLQTKVYRCELLFAK